MPESSNGTTWNRFRFDQMVVEVKDCIDDPRTSHLERYVGLEHLDTGSLKIWRCGSTQDVEKTKLLFKSGDIIFGRRNAYLRRVAVADFDGVCSAHAMVLRARPEVVLPKFLPFFMQTETFWLAALRNSAGSLSPTINWSNIAKEEFALPPLEEQQRIAEVLQSSNRLRESLASSKRSAETLLRAAVDAAAVRAVRKKSLAPLADLVEEDRPICYGILKPGTGFDGGIPVIKVEDYPEGEILEDRLLLTDPRIDREYKRSRLRTGDLLISIRGTIGRLAFVPQSLDGANITRDTARLSLRRDNDARYTRAMLESSFVQRQVAAFTTGLAVQGINIGELRRVQIPIVPFEQQVQLVREVVEVRTAIGALETRQGRAGPLLKPALIELERG